MCKSLKDVYEKQQTEAAKHKRQEEANANSNHVNEDQPEAEVSISHEDSTPGESVEREEEASKEAEPGSAQDAPAGPQLSEE